MIKHMAFKRIENEIEIGTYVTITCDTKEELDSAIREHDSVCINPKDPHRMAVLDHYPLGVHECGRYCGAMDEDKTMYCETKFVLKQAPQG